MEIKEDKILQVYRAYNVRKKVIQELMRISDTIPEEFKSLKETLLITAKEIYKKGIK